MNFIFISPNFPDIYSHFVKALKQYGVNVLGIGDQQYFDLNQELKENLTEYCYVSDMKRSDWMIQTVAYLQNKYGKIDYIESNNEYWMRTDAMLREWFNVSNGYRLKDLDLYQSKSGMKQFFKKAGLKTARYILVSNIEESIKFINEVGYPVFTKPNSGVGAADTFKIKDLNDLIHFHNVKPNEQYIMEEFIDGSIITFDGIANSKSDVVISFKETFPTPIAELVTNNLDMFYFAETKMTDSYRKLGEKIVKAFDIKSRCFHIELFKLNSDKPGFAKKDEIVALEVNLRSPGGNTPDLLNVVSKNDYYDTYANMIFNDINSLENETDLISFSINRKNNINYKNSDESIMEKYKDNLKFNGYYPPAYRDALGDKFFIFVFKNDQKKIDEFLKFVGK